MLLIFRCAPLGIVDKDYNYTSNTIRLTDLRSLNTVQALART